MQRYWTDTVWATVDAAVARATSGNPTVLVVEGDAGMGKSSLSTDLVARLTDFAVFPAEGVAGQDTPYNVLDQWGVHVPRTAQDGQIQPFVAAQLLRQLTDAAADVAPHTLLLVDDAQWADVESMEALTWLMRRATGDRLLVVLASRPLTDRRRESWHRWIETSDAALKLTLGGLSYDAARALIAEHNPDVAEPVAERLWLHTLGNPLYLTNLLAEHTVVDLGASQDLPAPTQYAAHITEVLARQPEDARRLAEALAVLGSGRVSLHEGAALAGLESREPAARQLVASGLIHDTGVDGAVELRWVHSLAARAVYQELHPQRRRQLHAQAAEQVSTTAAMFEHRLAATQGEDPQLAADLTQAAARLYDQHSYRTAAHYLRCAARLTAEHAERRRLRLDAEFCSLLTRSDADLRTGLDDVAEGGEEIRRALVLGTSECFSGRYREGVAALAAAAAAPLDASDPLPRYRLEMLLAWARTLLGHDLELIVAGLQRARSLQTTDAAMTSYRLLAEGHVAGRTGQGDRFAAVLDRLPRTASATPAELSGLLVWRATAELAQGLVGAATADLREVQHRQHDGVVDVLSNSFDSLLAFSYWAAGRWDLATVTFRAARDMPAELIALTTYGLSSLPWSTSGDFAEADRQLDEAAGVLEERPFHEAVELLLVAQVVRRHAGGSPAAQATLLTETRQRWAHTPIGTSQLDGLWAAHFALAHLWAGELDLAEQQLSRASASAAASGTVRATASWVAGLLAEKRGQPAEALAHLGRAVAVAGVETPLYRAHALSDYARLGGGAAAACHQEAEAIYTKLQAKPYLLRLAATNSRPTPDPDVYVLPLSEREYDVLTLIVEGYSYAQISRELFVSQGTVSYHMGNIFPKAGVRTRHELTQWVRQHPGSVVAPGSRI